LAINSNEHFSLSYLGTDVVATVVSGAAPSRSGASEILSTSTFEAGRATRFVVPIRPTLLAASEHRAMPAELAHHGKVRSANLRFAFSSLFSVPHVMLGVN